MNRIAGIAGGVGNDRSVLCIVGVAVYQVASCLSKSCQTDGSNPTGIMIALPAWSGDKNPATSPWMWNRGIISMVRSLGVRLYVFRMFPTAGKSRSPIYDLRAGLTN